MSAPLRFLGLAIVAYAGLRTAASALALTPLEAVPLPPGATPLLDALAPAGEPMPAQSEAYPPVTSGAPAQPMAPQIVPVYVPYATAPAYLPQPRISRPVVYEAAYDERPVRYAYNRYGASLPPLGDWPGAGPAGSAPTRPQATPSWTGRQPKLVGQNRWHLTSWALLRQPAPIDLADPYRQAEPSLASSGTLGGSQAGARLTYAVNSRTSVALRVSSPIDQRTGQQIAGEGALGVSWQPLRGVPVRLLAERRQRLGAHGGGRNAFALLAEGGLYERPLGWGLVLDGYAQGGMVGLNNRDLFVEGGAAVTRPLLGRFALGGGLWSGAQPGIARFDAGPRLSYRLTPRIRAHLDYRWQLIGNASPPSGPAVTLAGDF